MTVATAGDRAWDAAGRDTISDLVSRVRQHANAIDSKGDANEVHDLRTSMRRLRTAIKLHRDDVPKKRRVAVEDELKRVTRRLGAVRDLDVLQEELEKTTAHRDDVAPLRAAWSHERKTAAKRLRRELGRSRFRQSLENATKLVRDADGTPDDGIDRVATEAPALIWESFGAVISRNLDPDTADPAAIHQVRIAAKKFRYTLEAFEEALEPGSSLIQDVTALQDAAGSMHDAIVAGERARSTVPRRKLKRRQRRAIDGFADAQAAKADALRPTISRHLRIVRSRRFRETLGRAVAGMGRVSRRPRSPSSRGQNR